MNREDLLSKAGPSLFPLALHLSSRLDFQRDRGIGLCRRWQCQDTELASSTKAMIAA